MWELYDGHNHDLGHTLLMAEQDQSTTIGARVIAIFMDASPDEMRLIAAAPLLIEALEAEMDDCRYCSRPDSNPAACPRSAQHEQMASAIHLARTSTSPS